MKPKVLIVSRNEIEGRELASEVAAKDCIVFLEKEAKNVFNRIQSNQIQALVMNLQQFGTVQVALIDQIKALKYKFKIIILAEKVQPIAYSSVEDLSHVAVLSKSLINIERDFAGFLKRAITQEKIAKRVSKRHTAQQTAIVRHPKSGEMFNALVSNLSKTGASLEFNKGHLNIMDKILLIIPLTDLHKTHAMKAVVIWFEISPSGKRTAGVHFQGPALTSN